MTDEEQITALPVPDYRRAQYLTSAARFNQCPPDEGWEVAFAGRSNVGKSSAINKITNRRGLARISKSPGRTRELNYFSYDEHTHLVDLPGYGYAKVNESMRDAWTRVRPALAQIAADPKPAVIVTHKALMRVILGTACDWTTQPEIKRGRLYPIKLRESGLPRDPETPVRLEARSA